eukprot:TRINITY_DN2770_c0_g2_i1.p1 TRINITY_DN2770_c0_g2~~TRINITY_DN2770_c0_g2_i1.p1  ORF type:complete len:435 (+),score=93.88 TRINITY_DN2770_c0_g2_i1:47-1306(+)
MTTLLFCTLGSLAAEDSSINPLNLHLMTDKVSGGARCLDGSPGGFYISKYNSVANSDDWQLWLEGGGWCLDDVDCWGRSHTKLGQSTNWPQVAKTHGIMSGNCTDNPEFCNFNRVYVAYCDGTSYSGNIEGPITVPGKPTPIYYRGQKLLDAVFETLQEQYNLTTAKRFLFMGSSAGGLGAFINTERVHAKLMTITSGKLLSFKAIYISGFFLDHVNLAGEPVYGTEMRYIFNRTNATGSTNTGCLKANQGHEDDCFFAANIYDHVAVPTFVLNSAYDAYQTSCILTAKFVPNWPGQTAVNNMCNNFSSMAACQTDPEKCSQQQMITMLQYETDFLTTIQAKAALARPGNGAFLYSCHTHDTAPTHDYTKFTVNGTTMAQAAVKWWNSPVTTPAAENTYYPCMYHTGPTGPRNCNPSCT